MKQSYSSGAKWEEIVAYRRAVRIDNLIEVAGTTAIRDGEVIGKADPYKQTVTCFEIIKEAIEYFGATMANVIRTRIYVTNIQDWEEIGRAHKLFFDGINPASTMVEVSGLIDPDLLVEIEVTAYLSKD